MGWKLFLHSIRMVVDNLGVALRLSAVLYVAQEILFTTLIGTSAGQTAPSSGGLPEILIALLTLVVTVLFSLWIAVGWHRFVLIGERPAGFAPRWHGSEIGAYLWRSLGLGLMLGLLFGVLAGLALGVTQAVPQLGGVIAFGLVGLASYVFFRLGLVLPAAAVAHPLTLRDSWEATRSSDNALLVLALIVMGGRLLIEIPAMIDGDSSGPVSLIYSVVINWFVTMFGVSLLTTLYGHFIEGRHID
ncbi:hypothetical protein AL036_01950 [Salipiger aestuarii]|nr:hypothetical protein [Salipiger aestuarii]EIE50081.1 hypothetical protein C357_15111 [Citreicella sp. 357]KAA8609871.1 hypothetical protein AL036_01950 [Salipiger aestuarii]KAA8616183.1 hypothetical protein AL037_01100 [Salipiger aestuarii]KAB2543130.1 hypothetical protein AL035_03065 [Salipiger aestuarii]